MKVLSGETWGLSISLQDYYNNPVELMEKKIKMLKKKKAEDNLEYREL